MITEFFDNDSSAVAKKVTPSNPLPVNSSLPGKLVSKTIAFSGAAGNGAVGNVAAFTVTGDVLMRVFGVCTENLASAASGTVELGYSGATAALIAQTLGTDVDVNEIWKDSTPDASMGDISSLPLIPVVGGQDVILTVGTGSITDGTITLYCLWIPLSADANVVAA